MACRGGQASAPGHTGSMLPAQPAPRLTPEHQIQLQQQQQQLARAPAGRASPGQQQQQLQGALRYPAGLSVPASLLSSAAPAPVLPVWQVRMLTGRLAELSLCGSASLMSCDGD